MADQDVLNTQNPPDLEERTRRRAYEIWLSRGGETGGGSALEDWLEAEREILSANGHQAAPERAMAAGRSTDYSRAGEPSED